MASQSATVDMPQETEELMLIRVPAFVAEHWLGDASETGAPLGFVQPQATLGSTTHHAAASRKSRYSVRLDRHGAYPARYPHEFDLTCGPPAEPLYAFSRSAGKNRTRLEGRVALRGDVKPPPHLTKEYLQIMRDRRTKYSDASKRAIGLLDLNESEARVKLKARDSRAVDKEAKREARLERGPKVEKYDEDMPDYDALKALVLDKFGERPYWSKKELAEVTRQRPAHLGAALESLCDYVKVGSHKGDYELKALYK